MLIKLDFSLQSLIKHIRQFIDIHLSDVVKSSYTKSMYELQKGIGVGFEVTGIYLSEKWKSKTPESDAFGCFWWSIRDSEPKNISRIARKVLRSCHCFQITVFRTCNSIMLSNHTEGNLRLRITNTHAKAKNSTTAGAVFNFGGAYGIRTRDLHTASVARFQLR